MRQKVHTSRAVPMWLNHHRTYDLFTPTRSRMFSPKRLFGESIDVSLAKIGTESIFIAAISVLIACHFTILYNNEILMYDTRKIWQKVSELALAIDNSGSDESTTFKFRQFFCEKKRPFDVQQVIRCSHFMIWLFMLKKIWINLFKKPLLGKNRNIQNIQTLDRKKRWMVTFHKLF